MENISIKTWIERFDKGHFAGKERHVQIEAGWYDWFCSDAGLKGRLYKLAPKVKRIAKSKKVNIEKNYVFFKNNCPCNGELYDDFRICDIKSGDVIYTITPSCGHDRTKGEASVWGKENNFNGALVTGTMSDVYKFFEV